MYAAMAVAKRPIAMRHPIRIFSRRDRCNVRSSAIGIVARAKSIRMRMTACGISK